MTSPLRICHKPEFDQQKINHLNSSIPSVPYDRRTGAMKIHPLHTGAPFRVCYYDPPSQRMKTTFQGICGSYTFTGYAQRKICPTCLVETLLGVYR